MTTAVPTLRQDAQIISLVGVAHGVSHFSQLLLAPLFPWLKAHFGFSYAELGFLMTMFFVVSGFGQALGGFVVDRVGARTVLFSGLGLISVGALIMSQSDSYAMLMVGAIVAGMGNCVFHPADLTLLNQRVSASRLGHAFSVHGITGNLGWAAAPIFLTTIAGFSNWRIAMMAAACVPFAVLLLLVANRGVLGPGTAKEAVVQSAKAAKATGQGDGDLLGFMRLPAVWMSFAFFVITAMALGALHSFAAPSLVALYGVPLALATAGYSIYMLSSAGGMIWGGFLAAKTARHDYLIAASFTVSGAAALVIAAGVLPGMAAVAMMAVVGFGAGVAAPSRDLLIRAAAPKGATGRVYGVVYSGLDVGLAVSPVLFGALMDRNFPAMVFICIGIFQMLAIATAVGVGTNNARKAVKAQAA